MRKLFVLIVMALAMVMTTTPASAEPDVYVGTGWKIEAYNYGIQRLDTKRSYVFTFTNSENRTRFTPYLKSVASQLQSATGVKFTVSTTIEKLPTSCATLPVGHLIFHSAYRPNDGTPGMSKAFPCAQTGGAAKGGWVIINNEYWNGWYLPPYMYKNLYPHEAAHIIGMDHPNTCPKSDGATPVLCSPNGGYTNSKAGKYTPNDITGLRQLARNDRN